LLIAPSSRILCLTAGVTLLTALGSSPATAQTGTRGEVDTAVVPQLDTVVVTPSRSATSIRTSAVAVSSVPGSLIRALPFRSVGDALSVVPGIAVIDASSLGGDPRIIARGFYGGGDTDYVPAEIDGVPIAALGSGAVDWTMLPSDAFSRLEVVRGATSYLHGDAALGGTLNELIPVSSAELSWRAAGGSYGVADGSLNATHNLSDVAAGLAADYRSSNGYRIGENSTATNLHAKIEKYGASSSISGFIQLHGREFKDPGPLLTTTSDRRAQNGFFRFDNLSNRVDRAGLTGTRMIGPAKASGYFVGEYATDRSVKTLPLSTDFADTKLRRTKAPRLLTSGQVELGDDARREWGHLVAGVDASAGRLTSTYSDVVTGDQTAYANSNGEPGATSPPSRVTRTSVAGFMNWQLRPVSPLRITLGTRADRIADKFVPSSADGGSKLSKTHNAVSPRLAANLALPSSDRSSTNIYLSAARAFKAPTLDQLFDDRHIPIPVAPFSATTSNPDLVPQHGTSLEGGLYESWRLAGASRLDWSAALYREKIRDELDFDLTTFRYINIGRSLHRGGEVGVTWEMPGEWLAFGNFSQQQAVAIGGANDGKQLKAIPRRIASAGVNATIWRGLTTGVVATSLTGAYIDDRDLVSLPGYMRVDARVGIPFGPARVTIDVMNALDRRYDATAFPDPAGSSAIFRYPAAGRTFVIGLEGR
jgi:outer membrane receptor protein involved in Fe transport